MKKIYDYLGNEIKEGMTIQVVETTPFFSSVTPCLLNLATHKITRGETIKMPDKCWTIKQECSVVRINGDLFYKMTSNHGITCNFRLDMLEWGQPSDIITIKGISDIKPN